MSDIIGSVVGVGLACLFVLAWFTHVVTCLVTGSWGFLIAGAILFPIGIVHGFLILIGAI